jgi:hypothetical protein
MLKCQLAAGISPPGDLHLLKTEKYKKCWNYYKTG